MATDPFDSLRVRLTNHVAHRRSLGVLGLLGMASMALPDEATAKKKRKKKKNKKKKGQTTPAPTTTSTTTRKPGTCGAIGSSCGTAQTPCICGPSPTDVDLMLCVSIPPGPPVECLQDTDCAAAGKVCILEPINRTANYCLSPCHL